MESSEVINKAIACAGISGYELSRRMGRAPSYVSATFGRGSVPRADVLAAMLAPCGYTLCAVPNDDVPSSALVIDPKRD